MDAADLINIMDHKVHPLRTVDGPHHYSYVLLCKHQTLWHALWEVGVGVGELPTHGSSSVSITALD